MADFDKIKSQLEDNPADFDLDAIKNIPEELDKVIKALEEISDEGKNWGREQEKILASAKKYREDEIDNENKKLAIVLNGKDDVIDIFGFCCIILKISASVFINGGFSSYKMG